jgi:uncharacterized protein Yka (UPF0111/DUF47 family)
MTTIDNALDDAYSAIGRVMYTDVPQEKRAEFEAKAKEILRLAEELEQLVGEIA